MNAHETVEETAVGNGSAGDAAPARPEARDGAAPGEQAPDKEASDKEASGDGRTGGMSAPFILYLDGEELAVARRDLAIWVNHLLLPVYAGEASSRSPWCPRWWEHLDAVAYLYGLWMAWQELTHPRAGMTGPVIWHRDYLGPVMTVLRDPSGPFSGCKPGAHRAKETPPVERYDH